MAGNALGTGKLGRQERQGQQAQNQPAKGQYQQQHTEHQDGALERQPYLGRPTQRLLHWRPALEIIAERTGPLLLEDELQLVMKRAQAEDESEELEPNIRG